MAIFLLLIGAVLVITGVRGTLGALTAQLQKDFTGSRSFLPWVFAIAIIGSAGYVSALRKPANALLVLLLVSFILSEQGIWAQVKSVASE